MTTTPPPTLPTKERLILGLLISTGPTHGLRLVNDSDGSLKRGTVYVTLGRMEAKGLLVSEQETPHPGAMSLPRRIYRATPLGERVYQAWQTLAKELAWDGR